MLLLSCLGLLSKHVASQYRWQSADLDVLKLVKKKKRVFVSATDMKANGQLVYMMIGGELDFQKLQLWNRAVSLNIMICTKFSPFGSFFSSNGRFKP